MIYLALAIVAFVVGAFVGHAFGVADGLDQAKDERAEAWERCVKR